MERPPYTMRIPRKSAPEYYLEFVLPILLRRRVRILLFLTYSDFTFLDYRGSVSHATLPVNCSFLYEVLSRSTFYFQSFFFYFLFPQERKNEIPKCFREIGNSDSCLLLLLFCHIYVSLKAYCKSFNE